MSKGSYYYPKTSLTTISIFHLHLHLYFPIVNVLRIFWNISLSNHTLCFHQQAVNKNRLRYSMCGRLYDYDCENWRQCVCGFSESPTSNLNFEHDKISTFRKLSKASFYVLCSCMEVFFSNRGSVKRAHSHSHTPNNSNNNKKRHRWFNWISWPVYIMVWITFFRIQILILTRSICTNFKEEAGTGIVPFSFQHTYELLLC